MVGGHENGKDETELGKSCMQNVRNEEGERTKGEIRHRQRGEDMPLSGEQ